MDKTNQKNTRYYTSEEIIESVNAFENCILPPNEWTHELFLTVVFWHLYLNPIPEALRLIRRGIRRFNFENNIKPTDLNAYHETLIVFWVHLVHNFSEKNRNKYSFLELANMVLEKFTDKNFPLRFYSRECLFSRSAKETWVEPDLVSKPKLTVASAIGKPKIPLYKYIGVEK